LLRWDVAEEGGSAVGSRARSERAVSGSDVIQFDRKSGLSAGVPLVSETLQSLVRVPILATLPLARREYATVYYTEPLAADTRVCGTPNVTVSVTPSASSFQLVAYLYDVEPLLYVGTLLSHTGYNVWRTAAPGAAVSMAMRMRSFCADVPKGHMIGLGLDMYTEMLTPANTDDSLTLLINYDANASHLDVPILSQQGR